MMKSIFLLVAIIGLSHAAVTVRDQLAHLVEKKIDHDALVKPLANAGEYFDQVLANLREQMYRSGMNNLSLPDEVIHFEHVIGGINWHGEAALVDGSLRNMDTLHRTGTADLSVDPNGDIVITAEVGVNEASLKYSMYVTFMDLGPHCTVDGTLSKIRLLLSLRVRQDFTVYVDTLNIQSTGVLSVDIKGLGLILNFLAEIVVDFLGNAIKGFIVLLIEGPIKNLINSIIASILFPPEVFGAVQAIQAVVGAAYMLS